MKRKFLWAALGFTLIGSAHALNGGGILNEGNATIRNVKVIGNSADLGGGIYNSGSLDLANAVIVGNSATDGAGLYQAGTDLLLTNVSFGNNSASGAGGGLYAATGTNDVVNTILWGDSPEEVAGAADPVVSYSNIEGSGGSASWNGTAGIDGGGNIDGDPNYLAPPQGDLHLGSDLSPAINAGTNTSASAAGLTDDLMGAPRVQQNQVDMGAYEQILGGAAALSGTAGADQLVAQRVNTSINAGEGDDIVISALGRQVITLGGGDDIVVWGYYPDSDVINDFALGEDRLDVRNLLAGWVTNYPGGSPLLSGHMVCLSTTGGAYVKFDRDGSGTTNSAFNYALVRGAGVNQDTLCVAENFIF